MDDQEAVQRPIQPQMSQGVTPGRPGRPIVVDVLTHQL